MTRYRQDPAARARFEAAIPAPRGFSFLNPLDDAFVTYLERKYTNSIAAYVAARAAGDIDPRRFTMSAPDRAAFGRYGVEALQRELTEAEREELVPDIAIEGDFVINLRARTLDSLLAAHGAGAAPVREVPVLLLPSSELNGFTVLSPEGRPAIVLNTFLVVYMPMVLTTVYAASGVAASRGELAHWRHDLQTHAMTLVWLALVAMTGEHEIMRNIDTLADFPDSVAWSIVSAMAIEEFILLHEYAHVAAGDLRPGKREGGAILPRIAEAPMSAQQEIRADLAAAEVYGKFPTEKTAVLSRTERYAALAVLFQVLSLCDYVRERLLDRPEDSTHPPGHIRFMAIQAHIDDGLVDTVLVNTLLAPFQMAFMGVDFLAEKYGKKPGRGWREAPMQRP